MRRRLHETAAGRPRRGGDRRSRAARPPGRRPACLGRPPAHRRPAVSRRPALVAVVDREHAAPRATLACLARRRRRSRAPPRRRVLPFRLPHGEGTRQRDHAPAAAGAGGDRSGVGRRRRSEPVAGGGPARPAGGVRQRHPQPRGERRLVPERGPARSREHLGPVQPRAAAAPAPGAWQARRPRLGDGSARRTRRCRRGRSGERLLTLAKLTFLTPAGALVVLGVALPLIGLLVANRRIGAVRALLGLRPPRGVRAAFVVVPLVAVPALLALAAMQPAVRTQEGARVRTDVEVFFVFDTSRSMLAARAANAPTRLQRAKSTALRLRAAVPNVPAGVATLTDRVLPNLFPTVDAATFDSTVRDAVGIERPPPAQTDSTVTTFRPLADVATQGFFGPDLRRRILVVFTDGEARPDVSPARPLPAEHSRKALPAAQPPRFAQQWAAAPPPPAASGPGRGRSRRMSQPPRSGRFC